MATIFDEIFKQAEESNPVRESSLRRQKREAVTAGGTGGINDHTPEHMKKIITPIPANTANTQASGTN